MKLPYLYSYNTFAKATVVTAILAGLFFVGFGLLSVSPLIKATPGTSDFYLFLGLILVFCGFGLILSILAAFFHLRMSRLNAAGQWFGVEIDNTRLISDDYDIFKVRRIQINRNDIESSEVRLYRGNEFLHLKTPEKTHFLPIFRMTNEDKQILLTELRKPDSSFNRPILLTKADLETAWALFRTFGSSFQLKLKETISLSSEGFYKFGFDEAFPKRPHLNLSKCGPGGDSYSGYERFRNEFDLLYFVNEKNIAPRVLFVEIESDLAGYSQTFYFDDDTSVDKQILIRETFHQFQKDPTPLPESFVSFLNSQS